MTEETGTKTRLPKCEGCDGHGYFLSGAGVDDHRVKCSRCGGTGVGLPPAPRDPPISGLAFDIDVVDVRLTRLASLTRTVNDENLLPDEPAADSVVPGVLRALRHRLALLEREAKVAEALGIEATDDAVKIIGTWKAAAMPFTVGEAPDPAVAIANLDNGLAKLTAQLEHQRERTQAAEAERDALRAEVEAAEREALAAVQRRGIEVDDASDVVAALGVEVDTLRTRAERAEAEVERLTENCRMKDDLYEDLVMRSSGFEARAREVDALRARVAELESALSSAETDRMEGERERSALVGRVTELEVERVKAIKRLLVIVGEPEDPIGDLLAIVEAVVQEDEAAIANTETLDEILGAGDRELIEVATERMAALRTATERVARLEAEAKRDYELLCDAKALISAHRELQADRESLAAQLGQEQAHHRKTIEAAGRAASAAQVVVEELRAEIAKTQAQRDSYRHDLGEILLADYDDQALAAGNERVAGEEAAE